MANKVQQAMEAVGYYREGTKEELRTQYMEEQTITLAGKEYQLSRISYLDAKVFATELDAILSQQNPLIHDIFAKNAQGCFDLVRMVNINSKQGFKGALASGNELDVVMFIPRLFYDPDASTGTRLTWVRTISAVGSKNFLEGAQAGTEITMGEEEGFIYLANYNPAMLPCVDALKITMNTEPFDAQTLDFNQVQVQLGDPIIELKEPWTLPPEQSGEVEAYYFQTGTDEMTPLGIWVKMAKNLRDITVNGLRSTSST